ncbi:MAG: EAL domain-containing protein [Rhodomicrobiaceae bacterium]
MTALQKELSRFVQAKMALGRRAVRRIRIRLRNMVGSMALRQKLAIAFAALAIMAGICGALGLLFLGRIAGSVSVLSGVTSPLLEETMALINTHERMHSAVLDGASDDDAKGTLETLAELDAAARGHLSRMKHLAAGAGLDLDFGIVTKTTQDHDQLLQEMIHARQDKKSAEDVISEQYTNVSQLIATTDQLLRRIAEQFEAQIIKNEELAKIQVQTGETTLDRMNDLFMDTVDGDFVGLNYTYKLMEATAKLEHLAKSVGSIASDQGLIAIRRDTQRVLKTASAIRQKLATRMRAADQAALMADLDASFKKIDTQFFGTDQLIAKKQELLIADTHQAESMNRLDEIDLSYANLLTDVASAVRSRNAAAEQQTANLVTRGRNAVIAVVTLTALLALMAALFLIHRIIGPIGRLIGHIRAIGAEGALIAITDRSLIRYGDEIGVLARSFNSTIAQLGEARRQLIARSEAEIAKQADRLETALTNMSQGLCMYDRDQRLILCNKKYAQTYGISHDHIRPGMSLPEVLQERLAVGSYYGDAQTFVARRVAANSEVLRSDTVVEFHNGRAIHILRQPMKGGGWVSTHEDVTERQQIDAKIAHMARYDALTSLPNRVLFRERMEDGLVRVARGGHVAVHCLDLDNFKAVNDTLGHTIGDALLRTISQRLLSCVREVDTISRLGGDEFAIIQHVEDPQTDASALAQRVIDAVSVPLELDAHHVAITVSIGIANSPCDGRDSEQLLKNADLALYRAKADGRNMYRFFEPEMDARMQARRALELDLRTALAAHEFELYYQPLVNIEDGQITGCEALLRWRHPKRGLVPPVEFISLCEEIGLIVPIGEWVVHEACREASTWPAHIGVAVNLSPVQFRSSNLVAAVKLALADSQLAPSRLQLEITESVLLYETEPTLAALHQFKDLGVKISMDDFGTGYSSLSYLRSFPFDKIKIDRSFIHDLAKRDDCMAIVRAVTSLSSSLGITATAEGVETTEQLELLRLQGCSEAQGYLFSQPRPASEITQLLKDSERLVAA